VLLVLVLLFFAGFWRAVSSAYQAVEQSRDSQQQQQLNRAGGMPCIHLCAAVAMQTQWSCA
jgi:hypothetical protein